MLYDILDSFMPVFKVKLWVFFLAYYVHLGRLEEADVCETSCERARTRTAASSHPGRAGQMPCRRWRCSTSASWCSLAAFGASH